MLNNYLRKKVNIYSCCNSKILKFTKYMHDYELLICIVLTLNKIFTQLSGNFFYATLYVVS